MVKGVVLAAGRGSSGGVVCDGVGYHSVGVDRASTTTTGTSAASVPAAATATGCCSASTIQHHQLMSHGGCESIGSGSVVSVVAAGSTAGIADADMVGVESGDDQVSK